MSALLDRVPQADEAAAQAGVLMQREALMQRQALLATALRMHLQWFAAEDEGRTEEPTEHKIRKAREEGKVAKSQDVTSAIILLFTVVALLLLSRSILAGSLDMVGFFFRSASEIDITTDNTVTTAFFRFYIRLTLPILMIGFAAAILGNVVQVGFLFTTKTITPDLNRIAPRFGRFFQRALLSTEALFNLGKSMGKVVLLAILGVVNVAARIGRIITMLNVPFQQSFALVAEIAWSILFQASIVLLVIAIFDYVFQRRQHMESLKMSRQELKEERRTYEGDPLVKSRLKQRMQELLRRNMLRNVPQADVVITNPTHYAVALEYDRVRMDAPTVIAKGQDHLALRIREIAEERRVPVVENKPLARSLYSDVEVGETIPERFYEAVVIVLKQVYRMTGRVVGGFEVADLQNVLSNTFLRQRSDIFVAAGVIAVVAMLIIPVPTFLLDALMALNIVLSLLVILIVLYTRNALEFSVFPTLLLVATVFGLALNVSSTRLILAQGAEFNGRIVIAFGNFVVGTSGTEGLVIGIIIFVILIAVQFVVITKGATRVAEVAARFTLDALPGKQMAIEAEYNSGALTEEEAAKRKNELEREVDFYGAMDGASKFVSGNVKIGIFITIINIVGGIIVGATIHGESLSEAAATYIRFAVGDGLVTQFPALLISTATGIIVTRAISDGTFGQDITSQFSRQSKIYWIAAVFLLAIAFLPGFPWYVLIPMAGLAGFLAFRLGRRQAGQETKARGKEAAKPAETATEFSPVAPLDPLSLELGYGLVPLVDRDKGAELLDRVTRIRREMALDLGLVVPRIRIIDNMRLEPSEYCVKIRGVEVGRGTIRMNHYLAINPGTVTEEVPGERTTDPAFGLPAMWISEENRDRAERAGYTVVDSPSIIATHLTEVIKRNAADILGRQEVRSVLDTLRKDYPAVVDDVQAALSLGEIQKVLQGLLAEQVSIRNLVAIFEALADFAPVTKEPSFLIEKVRQALARQICLQYADEKRTLYVATLAPDLEQRIIESRVETAAGVVPALPPEIQRKWINALANTVRGVQTQGHTPIILCSEAARALVKASARRQVADLVVLSVPEIVSDIRVEALAEITIEE